MKILLVAIAMIAAPAIAQTAAPAPMDHSGHNMPGDHKGDEGKDCCAGMKADGKKMDCCDKAAAKTGIADPHAGHDMSKR